MQFNMNRSGYIIAYTYAIRPETPGNPEDPNPAGIGIWFGDHHPLNVSAVVDGVESLKIAEILAAREAILRVEGECSPRLEIRTTSYYLVNAMTRWVHMWKRNSWMMEDGSPVPLKDELIELEQDCYKLVDVEWVALSWSCCGHYGIAKASELASKALFGI